MDLEYIQSLPRRYGNLSEAKPACHSFPWSYKVRASLYGSPLNVQHNALVTTIQ